MKIKTKDYPEGNDIVVNQVEIVYSQVNEKATDTDDELKLSICHEGAGFYFVLESKRWAFDCIDDLAAVIADFQTKAGIK